MARAGFRTLVMAQKVLTPEEYGAWREEYDVRGAGGIACVFLCPRAPVCVGGARPRLLHVRAPGGRRLSGVRAPPPQNIDTHPPPRPHTPRPRASR